MATAIEHSARNTTTSATVDLVPLGWIRPSRLNPRKHFPEDALGELAESIKTHGLLEPLVVRDVAPDHTSLAHLEIIAGERRYRACKLADVPMVPVRNLGDVDDATALQLMLVENLQRADLDPLEEAAAYAQLNRVCGLKQAQIAAAVKRSQPAIANRMRLLDLPTEIQEQIRAGEISPSHGVALAKWSRFPAFLKVVADYAQTSQWTSKQLEEVDPFHYWQIQESSAVRRLATANFDPAVCQKCPWDAYRRAGAGAQMCLRPEHFDELEAARKAEIVAAAQVAAPGQPTSDSPDATRVSALPKLQDLKYGMYSRVDAPPEGCTSACPCRGQGVDYNANIVPICLDPQRLGKLQMTEKRLANKARRLDAKRLEQRITAAIDALTAVGPREIAVLTCESIHGIVGSFGLGSVWDKTTAGILPHQAEYGKRSIELDAMHALGDVATVKLALRAILGAEVHSYAETNLFPTLSSWYLAEGQP